MPLDANGAEKRAGSIIMVEAAGLRKPYMLGARQKLGRVRTVLKKESLAGLASGLHVSPVRYNDHESFSCYHLHRDGRITRQRVCNKKIRAEHCCSHSGKGGSGGRAD